MREKTKLCRAGGMLAAMLLAGVLPAAAQYGQSGRDTLVVTSTNDATANHVVVFKLNTAGTPSLAMEAMLPTGGEGGAGGNAGAVQFSGNLGAVANYASNTVTQLTRSGDSIWVSGTIKLDPGCTNPVSVAIAGNDLYVAGANCAEGHTWPSGNPDGPAVSLPHGDTSAGQIAVGQTWAAVTLKSGSVVQLPLTPGGDLTGSSTVKTLSTATFGTGNTPLGAAFWGDILGFNPAHSPDSFAIMDRKGDISAVPGPTPAFPSNAPCWLAKGADNIWYSGNSPGEAISIFFSDGQGGVFYKNVGLGGVATDITVSPDGKWLAVIYTASGNGYVAVFSIDAYGDLTPVATSIPFTGVTFNGVAFSQ